jgi:hypothetical protein
MDLESARATAARSALIAATSLGAGADAVNRRRRTSRGRSNQMRSTPGYLVFSFLLAVPVIV